MLIIALRFERRRIVNVVVVYTLIDNLGSSIDAPVNTRRRIRVTPLMNERIQVDLFF